MQQPLPLSRIAAAENFWEPFLGFFKKKWANPGLLFVLIFGLFKQTLLQFLQQINVKNVHPVSGARIRTHNLLITSLLP